jgi:hypothetical protein
MKKRDDRLQVIKEYILEISEKYEIPASEVNMSLNENNLNHLSSWRYTHNRVSRPEFINIINIEWKHLETKKVK